METPLGLLIGTPLPWRDGLKNRPRNFVWPALAIVESSVTLTQLRTHARNTNANEIGFPVSRPGLAPLSHPQSPIPGIRDLLGATDLKHIMQDVQINH